MDIETLAARAADIMADQQAMPDEGSLEMLREVVREAYRLGRSLPRSAFVVLLEMPFEGSSYLGAAADLDEAKAIAQADSDQHASSEKRRLRNQVQDWEPFGERSLRATARSYWNGCHYLIVAEPLGGA